jgi:flagellar motor switch protein FliM
MIQLTKKDLQNLKVGDVIIEKYFNEEYHLEVKEKHSNDLFEVSYKLQDVNSKKMKSFKIAENFNKEGDRKWKSSKGSTIIRYYDSKENKN